MGAAWGSWGIPLSGCPNRASGAEACMGHRVLGCSTQWTLARSQDPKWVQTEWFQGTVYMGHAGRMAGAEVALGWEACEGP